MYDTDGDDLCGAGVGCEHDFGVDHPGLGVFSFKSGLNLIRVFGS